MQSFSILLGLGTFLGLLLVVWRAPQKEALRYLDAGLWTLLGALIGGRGAYVLVNLRYYQSQPGEIPQVWLGGLSSIGALAGAMIAIIILSKVWNIPAGKIADMLIPLAGSLAVTAWLGCWVDRCAYGRPADLWWALPARDEWGVLEKRVPVQLIGAITSLALIWLLESASKRFPVPGLFASAGFFSLTAIILGLSLLRSDPSLVWNGLRLEAWGAIGLMITSCIIGLFLWLRWRIKKRGKSTESIQPSDH